MFFFSSNTADSNPEDDSWTLAAFMHPKNSPHHYSSKVLLPYDILKELTQTDTAPPYVFKIQDSCKRIYTICSVLDFALNENEIYMPSWMYEHLDLSKGDSVVLEYYPIKQGKGLRLQPHSSDFLEIENPRLELEKCLINYPVLTYGDVILLRFSDIGDCRFTVTDVLPQQYMSIYLADVDLRVEFDEPLDYKERMEETKTVKKYMEIKECDGGLKKVIMKGNALFLDWDNLNK